MESSARGDDGGAGVDCCVARRCVTGSEEPEHSYITTTTFFRIGHSYISSFSSSASSSSTKMTPSGTVIYCGEEGIRALKESLKLNLLSNSLCESDRVMDGFSPISPPRIFWNSRKTSFSDDGMVEIPGKWKGSCEHNTKFGVVCNRKLIGAKYFDKGYKSVAGRASNASVRTTMDTDGHGTHTISTAGDNFVPHASLFGYANGTVKGGSPAAHYLGCC